MQFSSVGFFIGLLSSIQHFIYNIYIHIYVLKDRCDLYMC